MGMRDNNRMCRLFGFKSVLDSQVHRSLIEADNALADQSTKHPDGWGVAYYRENIPHVIKSTDTAIDDHIFHKVSGVVSSKTVLAHIRKATQGQNSLINCHPFQYGRWVFAHNGNLKNFADYKQNLLSQVSDRLKPFILGTTDSELIFYLLLTEIEKHHPLGEANVPMDALAEATQNFLNIVTKYTGPLYGGRESHPEESHLTFILTTGDTLVGFNGGQHIKYSTHKSVCPDRDTCPHFQTNCESPSLSGAKINHLILSSEKHEGENIWTDFNLGELVGVNQHMELTKKQLTVPFIIQLS